MIRVIKPKQAPAVLRTRGAAATRKLKRLYDKAPADYQSGEKNLPIQRSIYSHTTVVATLREAQHNKCCFCERKVLGDVEHFRPKNGRSQRETDSLTRPGYYWLAYTWSNLYYACGPCNQRFKRNLFPLRRPARKALSHHHDIGREEPLLIDPGLDDPEKFIKYREEIAVPIRGNRRGRTTIDVLKLNRDELTESRGTYWRLLLVLTAARARFIALMNEAQSGEGSSQPDLVLQLDKIEKALSNTKNDHAEFAAMARSVFA